eukprot:2184421-Amphidinium_carterae.2
MLLDSLKCTKDHKCVGSDGALFSSPTFNRTTTGNPLLSSSGVHKRDGFWRVCCLTVDEKLSAHTVVARSRSLARSRKQVALHYLRAGGWKP